MPTRKNEFISEAYQLGWMLSIAKEGYSLRMEWPLYGLRYSLKVRPRKKLLRKPRRAYPADAKARDLDFVFDNPVMHGPQGEETRLHLCLDEKEQWRLYIDAIAPIDAGSSLSEPMHLEEAIKELQSRVDGLLLLGWLSYSEDKLTVERIKQLLDNR
jgi:hypothetical protein